MLRWDRRLVRRLRSATACNCSMTPNTRTYMRAHGTQPSWQAAAGAHGTQNGSFDAGNGAPPPAILTGVPTDSWEDWVNKAPEQAVAASALLWITLYFASRALLPFSATYRKWDKTRRYKARGLVPSTVFLAGIVPASIWVLASDAQLRDVPVVGATARSLLLSAVATGYFIYDSAVVLYHVKDDGAAFLVHGVLCLGTFGLATMYRVYQLYAPTFLLFEMTTFFVNARWLLLELGLKDSRLYLYNGLAMLFAWFVVRIVWGYWSSFSFWIDTVHAYRAAMLPVPIVLWYALANVCLNAMNTVWFIKILRAALKAVRPPRKAD